MYSILNQINNRTVTEYPTKSVIEKKSSDMPFIDDRIEKPYEKVEIGNGNFIINGDSLEILKTLPDNSVDSIVTDPPYGINFMNKEWDDPKKLKKEKDNDVLRAIKRHKKGTSPIKVSFAPFPGQGFKGRKEGLWFQQWSEQWGNECLRVLKPGGHLLSFCAPRMYHRMTCGLEDAGFEIREQIMWVFGSGFPKSYNIGKAIDSLDKTGKSNPKSLRIVRMGNEYKPTGQKDYKLGRMFSSTIENDLNQHIVKNKWKGWGTSLKPAHEPIVMARKPLSENTVAKNVLKWGTGGINIDESRITITDQKEYEFNMRGNERTSKEEGDKLGLYEGGLKIDKTSKDIPEGRFPANIMFDEEAAKILDEQSGKLNKQGKCKTDYNSGIQKSYVGGKISKPIEGKIYEDQGGSSRFFYCPKTSKKDRNEGLDEFEEKKSRKWRDDKGMKYTGSGNLRIEMSKNIHPTVKPTKLMEYLIKLVTPVGGTVLDPFLGSGTTIKACIRNEFGFIGIEKMKEYFDISVARCQWEYEKQSENLVA